MILRIFKIISSRFLLSGSYIAVILICIPAILKSSDIPGTGLRFKHLSSENGLSTGLTSAIVKDPKGFVWIATRYGLNRFDGLTNKIYLHDKDNPHSISDNNIQRFLIDYKGRLIISTSSGVNLYDYQKDRFISIKTKDGRNIYSTSMINVSDSLALIASASLIYKINWNDTTCQVYGDLHTGNNINFSNISSLYVDSFDRLWVCTTQNGLFVYNFENKKWQQFRTFENSLGQSTSLINAVVEDSQKEFWISSSVGLFHYSSEIKLIKSYVFEGNNIHSISGNHCRALLYDKNGRLWIGTSQDGLNLYDRKNNKFIRYYHEPNNEFSLDDDAIAYIYEDDNNFLWIGTNRGINIAHKDMYIFQAVRNIAGTKNSLSHDIVATTDYNVATPSLILTDLYFFDKKVIVGQKNSPLQEALNYTQEITLSHDQSKIFSIHFLALEYLSPERIRYRYKLEGFDDRWIETGASRSATFTYLDPGIYTFRLGSTNSDGQWTKNQKKLIIKILPPFYKSIWAYIIYLLLFISLVLLYHTYYGNLISLETDLKLEKVEREKAVEMEKIKSQFFANISHEFRTSLTLILVPLDKLISSETHIKQQLLLMQRSALRLFRLVNHVLDSNQTENGILNIECQSLELISFVRNIVESFISLASNKRIQLHFRSDFPKCEISIDPEKMDMVINNLLSNALKFTPPNGEISIVIENPVKDIINIIVEDSGPGISPEHLPHIFERFYHVDVNTSQRGTGIGLNLSKELVEKHGGVLIAENIQGQGARFTIQLPFPDEIVHDVIYEDIQIIENSGFVNSLPVESVEKDNVLLIVEDDNDVRGYLRYEFEKEYTVIEAVNGEEGYNKAIEVIPDIVISDIMMPEMDGLEFCTKLKNHELTNHIPVILLTARTTVPHQIEGLYTGADDYITKPFHIDTLRIKLRNLMEIRKKLIERYSRQIRIEATDVPINDIDAEFIKRAISIVEENISDPTLDVDKFSKLMGVSRSQLLRKLKGLTNDAPQALIRSIRLREAARLLKESKYSITEICYKTGFNYPAHFTRHFQMKFGLLPKEYRKTHQS